MSRAHAAATHTAEASPDRVVAPLVGVVHRFERNHVGQIGLCLGHQIPDRRSQCLDGHQLRTKESKRWLSKNSSIVGTFSGQ